MPIRCAQPAMGLRVNRLAHFPRAGALSGPA